MRSIRGWLLRLAKLGLYGKSGRARLRVWLPNGRARLTGRSGGGGGGLLLLLQREELLLLRRRRLLCLLLLLLLLRQCGLLL